MNSPVFPCARPLQPSCRSLRSGGDTGNLLCFRGVEQWDCAVSSSWIVSCDPVSKFIGILNRLFFLSRKIVQFEKINFFVLVLKRKDLLSFLLKLFIHACVNNFDRFLSKFYHRRERDQEHRVHDYLRHVSAFFADFLTRDKPRSAGNQRRFQRR